MNGTQYSGSKSAPFPESPRQTLKHALCVWSLEVCTTCVPVCAHKFPVGAYRCESVVCAHVCESTGLLKVPSAPLTASQTSGVTSKSQAAVSAANAQNAACSTRPALGLRWAGPRRLKARPPPHQAPAHVSALSRGISPSSHRGLRKSAMLKVTQPARNPLLKPLPILLAGRTPARPPHSPPPWAPPRALCPVGQGL